MARTNIAFCICALFVLIMVSGSGCGRIMPQKDPHTIYLHLAAEPGTLNPVIAPDAYSSSVMGYVYETLIQRDKDSLELVPDLARGWTISPDRLKYRFFIRKGIRWSDGKEFTADDVVYSYHKIMDPRVMSAQLKVYYREIRNVRKIDRYTVEFEYIRPYFLALEFCGGIPVVPRHVFDDGSDFNTHKNNRKPIGTGPYTFKEWDTGKKIVLVRNEDYWGKKPDIKRIVFKFISEENIALHMLKKGTLDALPIRAIQWVRQTDNREFKRRFYRFKYYLPNYRYVGWNSRTEYFNDKITRRALTHLINRKALVEKLLFGLGKIVTGNFYVESDYYNREVEPWPYDPVHAKKLLRLAGWKDTDGDGVLDREGTPFSFTLTIPSGRSLTERIATIIKEDLKDAGIQVEINTYEWAVFLQKIHNRDFEAVILGWSLGYGGDPYQLWHSSQMQEGSNFCGFHNKEADRIIEIARKEFEKAKRIRLYHRFHEIIHEEQPYTFLFCQPELQVVTKRFGDVTLHTTGLDLEEWTVRKTR